MKCRFSLFVFFLFILQVFYLSPNPIPSGAALSIVAPTTITTEGNYRLANDIQGDLIISASNVVVDLCGKTIIPSSIGVQITDRANVTVKNGRIANGPVLTRVTNSLNISFFDITLEGGTEGISILTSSCIAIQDCTFKNQTNIASITASDSFFSRIDKCTFSNNIPLVNGISLSRTRKFSLSNLAFSLPGSGIIIGSGSQSNTIKNCSITDPSIGISIQGDSNLIENSEIDGATFFGFSLVASNTNIIKNCVVNSSPAGISLSNSNVNVIEKTICNNNATVGIDLIQSNSNIIAGCIANQNAGDGIRLNPNCNNNLIAKNVTNSNGLFGITLTTCSGNALFDNEANENGVDGISAATSFNNYFFNNRASLNTASNFIGIAASTIATFDFSTGIFTAAVAGSFANLSMVP